MHSIECGPAQPVLVAREIVRVAGALEGDLDAKDIFIETGGEDLPEWAVMDRILIRPSLAKSVTCNCIVGPKTILGLDC